MSNEHLHHHGPHDDIKDPPDNCKPFYLPDDPSEQRLRWESHGRLLQAVFALGVGAGPIRISAAALTYFYGELWHRFCFQTETRRAAWLDEHDAPNTATDKSAYKNEASQVLDLSRSVGRRAAELASADHSFAITSAHLKQALDKFAQKYPPEARGDRGRYCTGP